MFKQVTGILTVSVSFVRHINYDDVENLSSARLPNCANMPSTSHVRARIRTLIKKKTISHQMLSHTSRRRNISHVMHPTIGTTMLLLSHG